MSQEVIEITEREVEIIEVIERGPVGPTGPQPDINYEVVSSARTLEAADLIAADTSGGAFTLTLPANPSNGDAVDIFDFSETFDTNPLTIARNGQPIESLNEDLVANVEGAYFTLIYTGATRGWQVLPRYGTSGGGGESALTTQGDMLYRGVGINTRLPIGSAGQILKVNSGATAPEWGAAPATGVTSVGITGSDGIEVDSGSPVTGSGSIALGVNAATLRSHINVADGANNYTHPNHSGEVTSSGDGATTIANDVVTNAKLANVDTSTIKGRATAGTGDPEDLTATQVRTILNVADGAEVNVQSNWTEADSGSDAFILNKPTLGGAAALNVGTTTGTVAAGDDARLSDSRSPTAHSSTHHTGGTDAIAPNQIGAAWALETRNHSFTSTSTYTLAQGRNVQLNVSVIASMADGTITLPRLTTDGAQNGDELFIVSSAPNGGSLTIQRYIWTGGGYIGSTETVVTTTTGGVWRFRLIGGVWSLQPVVSHTHAATDITSGTLDIARVPTGTTSTTVCIGDDARLSDARTPTSHTHGNITNDGKIGSTSGLPVVTTTDGAVTTLALGTANQVLRVNSGATGVEFGAGFDAASPPAIGNTTPAAGSFTTLNATSTTELVNGTNAAGPFRVYNTSSSANANYERGFMRWSSNVLQIGTEKAGTGSARALEFQVGGATKIAIAATGHVTLRSVDSNNGNIVNIDGNIWRYSANGLTLNFGRDYGRAQSYFSADEFVFGTYANVSVSQTGQVVLTRDADNTLAQRNGANEQTFRLYNTYTSATNFERLNVRWASNELILDAEAGSAGGTLRGIKIGSATSSLLGFYGVTPVDQPATVADPAGGGTVDTEARTAINAIIDRLQELGLIA